MKTRNDQEGNLHCAAVTSISEIAENGAVTYRGYNLHELAEHSQFEETAYLLLAGRLPDGDELKQFSIALGKSRDLPEEIVDVLKSGIRHANVMDMVQTAVSLFGVLDPEKNNELPAAGTGSILRTISRIPTVIAAYYRLLQNKEPIPPLQRLTHAQNFLYMVSGYVPDEDAVKALDTLFVLYAEDNSDMSSFIARISAASCSQYHSALTAALSSYRKKLRCGSAEEFMRLLLQGGGFEDREALINEIHIQSASPRAIHKKGIKSPGLRDHVAKNLCRKLSHRMSDMRWYNDCRTIEAILQKKGLPCTSDLYAGPVLHMLGVPIELFTPIFTISRIVGWTAHIIEHFKNTEIMKSHFEYEGPRDLTYIPIEIRKIKRRPAAA